jgi:cardiolipin synthase (CMP-forming)
MAYLSLLARFGTWESATVQWLDRGYTGTRMAAYGGRRPRAYPRSATSHAGRLTDRRGDGEAGPSRGADLSIPNLITLGRILLVPVVIWAITAGQMQIAFALFLAAGISDAVDGFLAKRFGMATELGAYLDPLADKAMMVSIYVALGITDAIPRWLVILVVSRDVMIVSAVILSWLVDKPMPLKPLFVSKLNTVAQIALACVVMAALGFDFNADMAVTMLTGLVAALTLLSVSFYVAEWVRHMNAADMGS